LAANNQKEEHHAKAAKLGSRNSKLGTLSVALQACADSVIKKAVKAWPDLVVTFSQIEVESVRHRPAEVIQVVLESGYEEYLQDTYTNHRSRLEDLEQLAVFARQFENTEDFLTQLALLTNLEAEPNGPLTRDTELVRLSTIHQAKGLEFDVVFVIMLCEGLFPSAWSLDRAEDEEEERRLFYVAITRARNELYLSYPLLRFTATGGDAMQQPSRFLHAISDELLDVWNLRPSSFYR
jgi:DNA helicase-2/ATP-dependent DNA helicase PcrA